MCGEVSLTPGDIVQPRPHHGEKRAEFPPSLSRLLRKSPRIIAPVALALRATTPVGAAVHPAALPIFDCWRPARAPVPRLCPTTAALAERLRLLRLPLHGVDFGFHL